MASHWYTTGLKEVVDGTITITSGCKIMLVGSGYTWNKDDLVVDTGGAGDAQSAEIAVTGYTGGWGGSGRKSVTPTVQADLSNDRVEVVFADMTWTTLAAGATIAAALLIKEGVANDTTSRLIAAWDVTDTATNGGDITLDFDATDGNLRLAT